MTAALFDDLKALALTVPDVLHADLWNNQIGNELHELPYERPAVFIEFGQARYEEQGDGVQMATVPLTLHIVTEFYHDTAGATAEQLAAWELKSQVAKRFHGYTSEHVNSLKRVEEQADTNYNNLFVFRQTYELTYYDHTTQKRQDWILETIPDLLTRKKIQTSPPPLTPPTI